MRAMVLAAGLGTRLRPLTEERPKPAVPFGLRPLVCETLEALHRFGVREVAINVHHLAERMSELVDPHLPEGMRARYLHEPVLLGTGGALANAASWLTEPGEPVIVMNSDIVFSPDLDAALAAHRAHDAVATMVLRPDSAAKKLGAIDVDASGRVRRLLGTPSFEGALDERMFTGVHVLAPRAFADFPAEGCIIRSAYRKWIDEGAVVAGVTDLSPWKDLGTLRAYLDANVALAGEGALLHPTASIEAGASTTGVVVGAGAHVGAVRLERVVVWPGARVEDDLVDAIVTPERVVSVGT
ncbi:MAG: NDP-sugar synthase [Sandaracinus sp.]|nr:NDP-sugar synthase [Sandaracinus sp.]